MSEETVPESAVAASTVRGDAVVFIFITLLLDMFALGVSELVGPLLFTLTFAYFIGAQAPLQLPGAPFLLAAAPLVLACVIAACTLSRRAAPLS
jgi:hypothetical protein